MAVMDGVYHVFTRLLPQRIFFFDQGDATERAENGSDGYIFQARKKNVSKLVIVALPAVIGIGVIFPSKQF